MFAEEEFNVFQFELLGGQNRASWSPAPPDALMLTNRISAPTRKLKAVSDPFDDFWENMPEEKTKDQDIIHFRH